MNKQFLGSYQNRLPVQHFHYIRFGRIHSLRYSANWQSKIMKALALLAKILFLLIFLSMANAGQMNSYQERIIISVIGIA
jgi:hypothetical protein